MNYLNIQTPFINFGKTLKDKIYVDKSLLIEAVNDIIGRGSRYICITRPRRFGKTINANMLGAYYTKGYDSRQFFDQLAISKVPSYETHRNKHNVIYIDLSRMPDPCNSYDDYIQYIKRRLKADMLHSYEIADTAGMTVSDLLLASGDSFIFILDEWDCIFSEKFMTTNDKTQYLKFIKGLLKDQPYVEMAYMTGVLPIAKYSSGSELNMFEEFNFMNDNIYDSFFGFSEVEVKELCEEYKAVPYAELEWWYNGYHTSGGHRLFNPRSVSNALTRGICLNYWTETGPMNEIADCIEHNTDEVREDIVKMVANIPVEVDLQGYSAVELQLDTRDEILSAMVVYGFLAYHDGYLRIPNNELMEKFQRVLSRNSMGEVKEIVDRSKEMLEATLNCDTEKVADLLEYVHDKEIPFLEYNDENALSCVITLCYLYARRDYTVVREEKSGKGYCDYLLTPKKAGRPAIVIELKVDGSCEDAIRQIKAKNYIQKVERLKEVILVGINYSKKTKQHKCIIEKLSERST